MVYGRYRILYWGADAVVTPRFGKSFFLREPSKLSENMATLKSCERAAARFATVLAGPTACVEGNMEK
jgi:hypothetical protein